MTSLTSLIERIEAATEGSRELDLAIHLALFPDGEIAGWMKYPRGLSSREGYSWDISGASLIFEKRTADGRCPHNGGVPLPSYTTSIDAVLTLSPEGLEFEFTNLYGVAVACMGLNAEVPCYARREDGNITLALLAAILRARQAMQMEAAS